MSLLYPELHTAPCIKKIEKPILTKNDVPYEAELVFNAGVAKIDGKYVMVFRNDYGVTEETMKEKRFCTSLGVAYSDNGIDGWKVCEKPLFDNKNIAPEDEIRKIYDPRITVLDGKIYLCLAVDTKHGVRGGIAEVSENFDKFEFISLSAPDNRNMVIFPEKIDGKYVRLERPFPVYSRGKDRFDIWLSTSPDLRFWGETELVLGVEDVPYANDKVGPAAPPIKTEKGWLTTFHAVDIDKTRGKNGWEDRWPKRYCAGIMLLDLKDPTKVVGMYKEPLIAPELPHEIDVGFRQNAIFPGGMIAEPNGEVKIYYGAADTVECVATANIDDLLALCTEKR